MLTVLFAAVVVALGMATPTPAVTSPNTATLKGGFNVGDPKTMLPQFCPCTDIPYQSGYTTKQRMYDTASRQITDWIAAHPGGTVMGFSQGSTAAIGAMYDHPNDPRFKTITFFFFGSPDTPSNVYPSWTGNHGRKGPPTAAEFPDQSNMTFVVRQYDSEADKPADTTNTLAMQNLKWDTHLNGYKNVDLDDPRNVVVIDPVTGRKTIYLPSDVLPMLKSRDWYTSDAKMKELDALYRPQIDAAYANNPGRPVIPAGPNRVAIQQEETLRASTSTAPTSATLSTTAPETTTTSSERRSTSATNSSTSPGEPVQTTSVSTAAPADTSGTEDQPTRAEKRAERKAERAAARAERKAEQETRKAEKQDAEKTADSRDVE